MPYGGAHSEMGTYNHLLRLSEQCFLEVIAIDPAAAAPSAPRWFGLDATEAVRAAWIEGRRLRGWVARTGDIASVEAAHAEILGERRRISRGERSWLFLVPADGSLPLDGVAPSVIDWGERGCPAPAMPQLGADLVSLRLEHPDPDHVRALYRDLGVANPPEVRQGRQIRYEARIATENGIKTLS